YLYFTSFLHAALPILGGLVNLPVAHSRHQFNFLSKTFQQITKFQTGDIRSEYAKFENHGRFDMGADRQRRLPYSFKNSSRTKYRSEEHTPEHQSRENL